MIAEIVAQSAIICTVEAENLDDMWLLEFFAKEAFARVLHSINLEKMPPELINVLVRLCCQMFKANGSTGGASVGADGAPRVVKSLSENGSSVTFESLSEGARNAVSRESLGIDVDLARFRKVRW